MDEDSSQCLLGWIFRDFCSGRHATASDFSGILSWMERMEPLTFSRMFSLVTAEKQTETLTFLPWWLIVELMLLGSEAVVSQMFLLVHKL